MTKKNSFSIKINGDFNEIEDIYDSNIEVFVTLEGESEDHSFTVIVGTPQNLEYLMEKDRTNVYSPGFPWIIVRKITKEVIEEAIQIYMDDKPNGYWLKFYHFVYDIDISVLDRLQAERIKSYKKDDFIEKLDELDRYLDNDFF